MSKRSLSKQLLFTILMAIQNKVMDLHLHQQYILRMYVIVAIWDPKPRTFQSVSCLRIYRISKCIDGSRYDNWFCFVFFSCPGMLRRARVVEKQSSSLWIPGILKLELL